MSARLNERRVPGSKNAHMASQRQRARAWGRISAAEARGHAILVALLLWCVAGVIAFAGSGYRSVFGPLKGSDFIQFYTLGHIDARTAPSTLYDPDAFHHLQTQLVPESDPEHYLIVYPPHVTFLFRPFADLTYGSAALVWAGILALTYVACVWLAWRPFKAVLPDRRLLFAAAAAFPPFWYLVLHGQTTIVPLLAFCLGWLALEHRRPFWAGMVLGLLLLKPQFALVLAVLVLVCREWSMLAGAIVSIGVQVTATIALLGAAVLRDYAAVVMRFGELRELLEPKPEQLHSISAVTNRLSADWGMILWALLSAVVIVQTIRVWRSSAPVALRTGVLVVASVLVNPHVFVYDAVVLAPVLVWLAAWVYREGSTLQMTKSVFVLAVYGLSLSLLVPSGALIPIQLSVLVLAGLFAVVSIDLLSAQSRTLEQPLVAISPAS
jgi:alpha-1,2-mannosyltransferase